MSFVRFKYIWSHDIYVFFPLLKPCAHITLMSHERGMLPTNTNTNTLMPKYGAG